MTTKTHPVSERAREAAERDILGGQSLGDYADAVEAARVITEELMMEHPEAAGILGIAGTRIGALAAALTDATNRGEG